MVEPTLIKFDHFGVPVKEKREGMIHFPDFKVWCSDYEKDPLRIEYIYFEKGNSFHPLIQSTPHICFLVQDITKALIGKKLLLPLTEGDGYRMAFIEEKGAIVEFISTFGR